MPLFNELRRKITHERMKNGYSDDDEDSDNESFDENVYREFERQIREDL